MAHIAHAAWIAGAGKTDSSAEWKSSSLLFPADSFCRLFQGVTETTALDEKFCGMGISGLEGILQSEVERIHSDLFSDAIELSFHGKADLRNSMSSHGPSHGLIGINMVAFKEKIFEAIGKHDEITGQGNHQRGRAVISAPISNHLELLGALKTA